MMSQGELGFKYEVEHQGEGMTGMGGIGPYLDLACRSGMVRSVERHVKAQGEQGWTDAEGVLSLVMLNLVGGEEALGERENLECAIEFCDVSIFG